MLFFFFLLAGRGALIIPLLINGRVSCQSKDRCSFGSFSRRNHKWKIKKKMHTSLPGKYWSRLFLGKRYSVKFSEEFSSLWAKEICKPILLFLGVEKISITLAWEHLGFIDLLPSLPEKKYYPNYRDRDPRHCCIKSLAHGLPERP